MHADAFGPLRRSELIVRRDVELLHQLQERDGRDRLRHAGDLDVGLVGEQNVRVEERNLREAALSDGRWVARHADGEAVADHVAGQTAVNARLEVVYLDRSRELVPDWMIEAVFGAASSQASNRRARGPVDRWAFKGVERADPGGGGVSVTARLHEIKFVFTRPAARRDPSCSFDAASALRNVELAFPLDRQQGRVCVIDLQGGMGDLEALLEHLLEGPANRVTVGVACNQYVSGQNRVTGRQLPHVQVVHFLHVLAAGHGEPDLVGRHALRRAFKQNADRFALQVDP